MIGGLPTWDKSAYGDRIGVPVPPLTTAVVAGYLLAYLNGKDFSE